MKKTLLLLAAGAFLLPARAQEGDDWLRFNADARVDFSQTWNDGDINRANSGFQGKYLNLRLDGTLAPGLTYHWRQRLNKASLDAGFFNATDWIYLDYAYRSWNFSAGKQVVAIGGWEYDRAPIDIYAFSVFTGNVPCYDFGASVAWNPDPADQIKLQAVQSPFFTPENRNMYAYNLYWSGTHGCWQPLWSANMVEYAEGRYISYLALGNRFNAGPVTVELDLMNRAASHQTYFFKDCSVVADVKWNICPKWSVFAKGSYDVNHSGTGADLCVMDGTELKMAGAGVEFFPLRNGRMDLRLHADVFYAWGTNANTADLMQNKTTFVNVGLKWNMNLVNIKRK